MKSLSIILFLLFSANSLAQYVPEEYEDTKSKKSENENNTLKNISKENLIMTIGILNNGSLIGFDLELMATKKIGFQIGTGLIGFGGSVNFHFKPKIRSSFVGFQYIHQGIGGSHVQSLVGPHYTFRGKKWFTFSTGLAYRVNEGPALPSQYQNTEIMLTLNIGGYFTF